MKTKVVRVIIDENTVKGNDVFALIEPLWERVDIYGSVQNYQRTLAPFSRSQRHLLAIHWYRSEVNNGGHEQFFSNSTGIVWRDAVAGLEAIDLRELATIGRKAAARLKNPSRDRTKRQRQLERYQPSFDDLDRRFYELERSKDLDGRMLEYARSHSSDFYFKGTVTRVVRSRR